jgi:chaperonin cofactor prefoldin
MGTRRFRTPQSERQSALESATQLMEEREKYESWLEDLEAKKDSTPPKVFDRVRQDYLARLQTVIEQLSQYTETLEEHAQTLQTKLRELEMAEEAITEQQEEAGLRKKVGEITAAEWDSSSKKAQKELAKNREQQESMSADLERIRSLLEIEEEAEEPPPPPKKKSKKDFNELEFLTSVVGSAPTAPPPERKSGEAARKSGEAERTSGAAPKTPTPPAAAPAQAAAPVAAPPPAAATPATPGSQPAQSPIATQRKSDAALTVSAEAQDAEQPKTLKCTECGAMNYPSEWYCERCGAELTVV